MDYWDELKKKYATLFTTKIEWEAIKEGWAARFRPFALVVTKRGNYWRAMIDFAPEMNNDIDDGKSYHSVEEAKHAAITMMQEALMLGQRLLIDAHACVATESATLTAIASATLTEVKHTAWVQPWEESERGWGVRPDGYTLHLERADADLFLNAMRKREMEGQPADYVPDEYTRPACDPYETLVDEVTYLALRANANEGKHGVWGQVKNLPPKKEGEGT